MKKMLAPALLIMLLAVGAGIWKAYHSFDSLTTVQQEDAPHLNEPATLAKPEPVSVQVRDEQDTTAPVQQKTDAAQKLQQYEEAVRQWKKQPQPTTEDALNAMTIEQRIKIERLRKDLIKNRKAAARITARMKAQQVKEGEFGLENHPEYARESARIRIELRELREQQRKLSGSIPIGMPDDFWQ